MVSIIINQSFSLVVGATALWALAGDNIDNQKRIAEVIGINILVDMIMTKSEKLQYVAGMALTALGQEDMANQNRIAEGGGIIPLVRILRGLHLSSEKVGIGLFQSLSFIPNRTSFLAFNLLSMWMYSRGSLISVSRARFGLLPPNPAPLLAESVHVFKVT